MFYSTFLSPRPPLGSPRKAKVGCLVGRKRCRGKPPVGLAGFWLGFGLWLASAFRLFLRISDGSRLDSRSGVALAWLRLDLASGLSFTMILVGFGLIWFDFGLIWVDFGWIWFDFGWIWFGLGLIWLPRTSWDFLGLPGTS